MPLLGGVFRSLEGCMFVVSEVLYSARGVWRD